MLKSVGQQNSRVREQRWRFQGQRQAEGMDSSSGCSNQMDLSGYQFRQQSSLAAGSRDEHPEGVQLVGPALIIPCFLESQSPSPPCVQLHLREELGQRQSERQITLP